MPQEANIYLGMCGIDCDLGKILSFLWVSTVPSINFEIFQMLTFFVFFQKLEVARTIDNIYKIKNSGLHPAGGISFFDTKSSRFKLNVEQTANNNLAIITLKEAERATWIVRF